MTTELDNNTLEWAAQWIEGSLKGEPDQRVREFGKNMATTLRAAKTAAPVVATGDDEGERMRAAFQDAKDSLDPEGKWTAGDVSNFSALFFAGWNAHASGSSSNKEAIHLSITPFYAICGNGGRDARTTQVPAHVTCDTCAEYWAKFITNYFYGGEITMDDVTRLVLEANSETSTLKKGQTVHVDGIPYELLDDVAAFSATDAAALRTPVEGEEK